jgi:hypothetical protein
MLHVVYLCQRFTHCALARTRSSQYEYDIDVIEGAQIHCIERFVLFRLAGRDAVIGRR